MRQKRIALVVALILLTTMPLLAGTKRRAAAAPAGVVTDALGIGRLSGAALAGTVASVDGTIVTIETGGAPAIRIEAKDAKILAADEMLRTMAEIEPGARITAFVENATVPGGPLPARLILVEVRPELMLTGTVDSVDLGASSFRILGIAVAVDAGTVFSTAFPTFAPVRGLVDLAPGNVVKVDAAISGSVLLAKRVLIVAPASEVPTTFRGVVKSISETSWVITEHRGGDVTLAVNDRTKVAGDPKVGDEVQVVAERNAEGGWVALAIVKLGPVLSNEFQFRGWVQSIAADRWTIGGPPGMAAPSLTVRITPATQIYADPKVGDAVSVKGVREANGDYVATAIAKEKR